MDAEIIQIDVRSGDVPSVRVNFMFGDNEPREYKNCYAWYTNGLVYIVHYQDHPNMIPRAVFNADHIFVEHFGPHPHPPQQRKPKAQPEHEVKVTSQRPGKETVMVTTHGQEGEELDGILDRHLDKLNDLVDPQKPLPSDPKDDAEPSTVENSGSDRKILETPSGAFRISPVPEENTDSEPTRVIEPTAISKGSRSTGRKGRHGSHARPPEQKPARTRALPGTTALLALAMFLALSFRHNS